MKPLTHRIATSDDLDLLAEWNHQLIHDEGHSNPMTVDQLKERMREWLKSSYQARLFFYEDEPVGYSLHLESDAELYLRHLFVRRDRRRQGLGREMMRLLLEIWPKKRLTVAVLCSNRDALRFYQGVGYRDYCLTMEIKPA